MFSLKRLIPRVIRRTEFYKDWEVSKKTSWIYSNEDKKYIFVHNPKCAGTSIKNILGFSDCPTNHRVPSDSINVDIWNEYTTIVMVRHPLRRLVSSWQYHTQDTYTGAYYGRYGDKLRTMGLKEYFHVFKREQHAIRPQVEYVTHRKSPKKADVIIKVEDIQAGIEELIKRGIVSQEDSQIPQKNKSQAKQTQELFADSAFLNEVIAFYKEDFEMFGYEERI
ncbi:sulfotransferase family 2 domain-containing protein [Vibrio astriarenae]|uniref:sulfotransferase family 2 domain-containing protein n=1 Tax=Vibrio astriarenae TaxID=1481923 RepID=UPI003736B12B